MKVAQPEQLKERAIIAFRDWTLAIMAEELATEACEKARVEYRAAQVAWVKSEIEANGRGKSRR